MDRDSRATLDRMERETLGRIEMVRTRKMDKDHSSARVAAEAILLHHAQDRITLSSDQEMAETRMVLHVSLQVLEARA